MTDRFETLVRDADGSPLAAVTATSLTDDGDDIVESVRRAVEGDGT